MKQKETIEGSLRRLEEIVEQLGGEAISLDDSLALFSEGMKLSQKCLQQLEEDLEETKEELRGHEEDGRLECGVAYAGTEICIGDEIVRLRQENRQCIAKMVCGEIVVM